MDRTLMERKSLAELRQIASTLELKGYQRMKKADLVGLIIGAADAAGGGAGSTPDAGSGDAGSSDAGSGDAGSDDVSPSTGGSGRKAAVAASETEAASPPPPMRPRARRDATRSVDGEPGRADEAPRGEKRAPQRRQDPSEDRGPREVPGDRDRPRGEGNDDASGNDGDGADGGGDRARSKRERRRKGRGGQGGGQGGGQANGGGGEQLDDAEVREGVLDLLPEGYGFLRVTGYLAGDRDVYVSQSFVRRFDLRRGDRVAGPIRRNKNNDKFPALGRVDAVEGVAISELDGAPRRPEFDAAAPQLPTGRLPLTAGSSPSATARLVDLVAPLGRGQRALVVGPARAGASMLLQELAAALAPADVDVLQLLVDERPEEVAHLERVGDAEVVASTFDRPAEDHVQVAELTVERAKRLAERGRDVVVLLDSLTRLGRGYHAAAGANGRTTSSTIDTATLQPLKRLLAAARDLEGAGSLTIVAAVTSDSPSATDARILEEVRPAATAEIVLDGRAARLGLHPAIDVAASGTHRAELLGDEGGSTGRQLRLRLDDVDVIEGLTGLLDGLEGAATDEALLEAVGADR